MNHNGPYRPERQLSACIMGQHVSEKSVNNPLVLYFFSRSSSSLQHRAATRIARNSHYSYSSFSFFFYSVTRNVKCERHKDCTKKNADDWIKHEQVNLFVRISKSQWLRLRGVLISYDFFSILMPPPHSQWVNMVCCYHIISAQLFGCSVLCALCSVFNAYTWRRSEVNQLTTQPFSAINEREWS